MTPLKPAGAGCPLCRKAVTEAYRPFCSKRCADVDLQRWLTGAYVASSVDGDPQPRQHSKEDNE